MQLNFLKSPLTFSKDKNNQIIGDQSRATIDGKRRNTGEPSVSRFSNASSQIRVGFGP